MWKCVLRMQLESYVLVFYGGGRRIESKRVALESYRTHLRKLQHCIYLGTTQYSRQNVPKEHHLVFEVFVEDRWIFVINYCCRLASSTVEQLASGVSADVDIMHAFYLSLYHNNIRQSQYRKTSTERKM